MGLSALCYWVLVTNVHRKLWEFDQIDVEVDRCGGLHSILISQIKFYDDVETIKL